MTSARQALGSWGEARAADFLSQKGYLVVERNYRTPYGEIDIIAQHEQTLVFVEVKTRSTDSYGLPEASVTAKKRAHLEAAAQAYLQTQTDQHSEWRIDVIAIRKRKAPAQPEIIHFENAVS